MKNHFLNGFSFIQNGETSLKRKKKNNKKEDISLKNEKPLFKLIFIYSKNGNSVFKVEKKKEEISSKNEKSLFKVIFIWSKKVKSV